MLKNSLFECRFGLKNKLNNFLKNFDTKVMSNCREVKNLIGFGFYFVAFTVKPLYSEHHRDLKTVSVIVRKMVFVTERFFPNCLILLQKPALGCWSIECNRP